MVIRVITAVVGLPLLIFFIYLGGMPLYAASCVLALLGMWEFYKAVSKKIKKIYYIGFIAEILFSILLCTEAPVGLFCVVFTALFIAALAFLTADFKTCDVNDAAVTILGFLYVGVLINIIPVIRSMENGLLYVWLVFIFAFVSDTGAYFVGVACGKHKLAPVLSPKKSIEGAVGGVVSAAVVTSVYAYVFLKNDIRKIIIYFIIGAIGSVIAQLGDLTASAVKRQAGIKDYGKIFPGHGGVLDRFDSVLFTSAFVFICRMASDLF